MPALTFDPAKKILALDCALRTGYAHSVGIGGVHVLGSADPGAELRRFILSINADYGIREIALEYSAFGGKFKRTKDFHNQLLGVVKLVCSELGLPSPTLVNPMTMKAFFAGSGRAKKTDMIAAAKRLLDRDCCGDEADAWAVLTMADSGYKPMKKAKPKRAKKPKLKQSRFIF